MVRFSVIIPVYDDRGRLMLCLEALCRQSFNLKEVEVVVVNNDPNEVLQLEQMFYDRLNLRVETQPFPGSYAARNKGIEVSVGQVLAFTDSDCIPDLDWLQNAYSYFENDKTNEIGILAGDVPLFFKKPTALSAAEVYEKYTGFTFEAYAKDGYCGAGNWFSYRKVINEFGGFNPLLKSNGDTELSGRISKKYKVVFAPNVVVRHPARYLVQDLVLRYQRLIGGAYDRRFSNKPIRFFFHVLNFSWRRMRFSLKKFFTVKPTESLKIFVVCVALTLGAWEEYFRIIRKGDTKR